MATSFGREFRMGWGASHVGQRPGTAHGGIHSPAISPFAGGQWNHVGPFNSLSRPFSGSDPGCRIDLGTTGSLVCFSQFRRDLPVSIPDHLSGILRNLYRIYCFLSEFGGYQLYPPVRMVEGQFRFFFNELWYIGFLGPGSLHIRRANVKKANTQ